jgi:hypothetical protein
MSREDVYEPTPVHSLLSSAITTSSAKATASWESGFARAHQHIENYISDVYLDPHENRTPREEGVKRPSSLRPGGINHCRHPARRDTMSPYSI